MSNLKLRVNDPFSGILVVGRRGSGKTTFVLSLILAILKDPRFRIWIFDFKYDYSCLIRRVPQIYPIHFSQLMFNLLRPFPGIKPVVWKQLIAEIWSHAFHVMTRSKSFIIDCITKLYKDFGVNEWSTDNKTYPSFIHLHDLVELTARKQTRNEQAKLNSIRMREVQSILGPIFNHETGWDIQKMLSKNIIFILADLASSELQNFLIEFLYISTFFYRKTHQIRGEPYLVNVFDEGHRMFDVSKENSPLGMPLVERTTLENREFRMGMIVASQEVGKLSRSIRANTGIKVIMSLTSPNEVYEVAQSAGLNNAEREQILDLKVGEAIVRVLGR